MDFYTFANRLTAQLKAIRFDDPNLPYTLLKLGSLEIRLYERKRDEQRKILVLLPLVSQTPSRNLTPLNIAKPCPIRLIQFRDPNDQTKHILALISFVPYEEKTALVCLKVLISKAKGILDVLEGS